MSNYNEELQSNNTDLQSILDTVNALPEASGGAAVETCNITMDCYYTGGTSSNGEEFSYGATVLNESGEIVSVGNASMGLCFPYKINNVVVGSAIYIIIQGLFNGKKGENIEIISSSANRSILKATKGGELSLVIYDDD